MDFLVTAQDRERGRKETKHPKWTKDIDNPGDPDVFAILIPFFRPTEGSSETGFNEPHNALRYVVSALPTQLSSSLTAAPNTSWSQPIPVVPPPQSTDHGRIQLRFSHSVKNEGRVVLGSDPNKCDILVEGYPEISGAHCAFEFDDKGRLFFHNISARGSAVAYYWSHTPSGTTGREFYDVRRDDFTWIMEHPKDHEQSIGGCWALGIEIGRFRFHVYIPTSAIRSSIVDYKRNVAKFCKLGMACIKTQVPDPDHTDWSTDDPLQAPVLIKTLLFRARQTSRNFIFQECWDASTGISYLTKVKRIPIQLDQMRTEGWGFLKPYRRVWKEKADRSREILRRSMTEPLALASAAKEHGDLLRQIHAHEALLLGQERRQLGMGEFMAEVSIHRRASSLENVSEQLYVMGSSLILLATHRQNCRKPDGATCIR